MDNHAAGAGGKGSGGGIPSVGRIGAANKENLQSVEKSNWLLIWK